LACRNRETPAGDRKEPNTHRQGKRDQLGGRYCGVIIYKKEEAERILGVAKKDWGEG